MIKLEILNKTINCPSNPNEISLDKGLNINYIWNNQDHNLSTKIEILFILTGLNIWNKVKESTIDDIFKHLNIFDLETDIDYYDTFKIKGTLYGIHKLDRLTVKEYSDLEFYLTYDRDPLDNLDKLCAILFRPIKTKNISIRNILNNIKVKLFYRNFIPINLNSYTIEEYNEDLLENSEIFRHRFTYAQGLIAIINYVKFKEQLMDEFKPLFGKSEEPDPFKEQEIEYRLKNNIELQKTFEEQWGFYHTFMATVPELSERDLWLSRDIREFFKLLVYNNIVINNNNNKNKEI